MGFARVKGRLTSRIGSSVKYGAPNDVSAKGGGPLSGEIVDEVWANEKINKRVPHDTHRCAKDGSFCWGDYSFFSQLIAWQEGKSASIRLGYYRRRCGEDWWEFGSQTTVSAKPEAIKTLLTRTLAKRDWFAQAGRARP